MASQSSIASIDSFSGAANPSKRRRLAHDTAAAVFEEDEAEELRNRRMQHIVENARAVGSPVNSPGGERNRQKGKNGMTNFQISEHYSNCLKLSAENKINSKNAFNLHLIDFMSDMLRQHDQETNFQIAGTTLDASAKIYAYRVDSVHRETFKIAGGLGRTDKESNAHQDEDGVDGGDNGEAGERPQPKAVKKRKKKVTKGNTIETNDKNLNMNVAESQFAGDALFDKVRSNFDEGGSSGLFLNTLSTANDSNRLLLHCLIDPMRLVSAAGGIAPSNMAEIDELLSTINLTSSKSLCPDLGDFAFLGWKPDATLDQEKKERAHGKTVQIDDTAVQTAGRFAVELPPQPDFGLEDEADDDHGGGFDDDADGWNHEPPNDDAGRQERRTTLDVIASAVSSQPLEYSYFDPQVVSSLAGASHWKVQAKLNSLKREHGKSGSGTDEPAKRGRKTIPAKRQAGRKRKGPPRVEFDEEIDVNSVVPMGVGATQLSNAMLKQWKEKQVIAEEEEDADSGFEQDFGRLFTKPDLFLVGNPSPELFPGCGADGQPAGDFSEERIITDNRVVDVDDDGGNQDIDFGAISGGEDDDDITTLQAGIKQELVIGDEPVVQVDVVDDGPGCSGVAEQEQDLLQQPYKVNKIAVPYARQAKKIDVKRLKRTMWNMLTKNEDESDTSLDQRTSGVGSPQKTMAKPKKLSELCDKLPDMVPESMAENLSTPIVFVCLLHMCNEKTLSLECKDDMSDLIISPGLMNQEEDNWDE